MDQVDLLRERCADTLEVETCRDLRAHEIKGEEPDVELRNHEDEVAAKIWVSVVRILNLDLGDVGPRNGQVSPDTNGQWPAPRFEVDPF